MKMCAVRELNLFVVIILAILPSRICDSDVCLNESKDNVCSCVFPNGTGIDITPLANSTFYIAKMFADYENQTQIKLSEYYFHPCSDMQPPLNSTDPKKCGAPLSICRHVRSMTQQNLTASGEITYKVDGDTYEYMGSVKEAEFSPDGSYITYLNLPSKTLVYLVCAQTEDQLHIKSLAEPNAIELAFYSKNACLRELKSVGRSVGSTLCIIFFSFVIFYLVLGMCTKKFLMGATGIEIIPNLAFWSDLPNLVRDGWAFLLNGFKLPSRGAGPPAAPNPNSYDSI